MSEASTPPERIADAYLSAAHLSYTARLVRNTKQYRFESRGLLLALEIILGMEDACRLIEERRETHRSASYVSIDKLLYDFWKLDRPKEIA